MDAYLVTLFMGQSWWFPADAASPAAVLLYFGPETLMPVGSFLAAMVGMLLLFWRQTVAMARNGLRKVFVRRSAYSRMDTGDSPDPSHRDEAANRTD
jgi:hypothetical protein